MIVTRVFAGGFGAEVYDPDVVDAAVYKAQAALLSIPAECRVDCAANTRHHFADGIYCRELFMPSGSILTGKLHRKMDILIIAQGRCQFITRNGVRILQAPAVTIVEPGTKPVILCETDVTFINALPNEDNCKDIETLDNRFAYPEMDAGEGA